MLLVLIVFIPILMKLDEVAVHFVQINTFEFFSLKVCGMQQQNVVKMRQIFLKVHET